LYVFSRSSALETRVGMPVTTFILRDRSYRFLVSLAVLTEVCFSARFRSDMSKSWWQETSTSVMSLCDCW